MMFLKPHRSTPPGGNYFYRVPDTGVVLEHPVMDQLLLNLRAYYANNRLECPADLRARVEDWMCRQMPPGVCDGTPEPGTVVRKIFTKAKVRDFSRLLFERARAWAGNRLFHVEQREAERRASICAACPLQDRTMCVTCDQLEAYAATFLYDPAKQVTAYDNRISVCEVCGCLLRAKVWVRSEALRAQGLKNYPKWCWMNPTGGRLPTPEEVANEQRRY